MSHSHRYIRHIRKILFNNNKSFFFANIIQEKILLKILFYIIYSKIIKIDKNLFYFEYLLKLKNFIFLFYIFYLNFL